MYVTRRMNLIQFRLHDCYVRYIIPMYYALFSLISLYHRIIKYLIYIDLLLFTINDINHCNKRIIIARD